MAHKFPCGGIANKKNALRVPSYLQVRLLLIRYLIAPLIESRVAFLVGGECFVFHSRSLKIIKVN